MKRWTMMVLSVLAVAGTALAVSEKTDPDGSAFPHWFKAGLYVGGTTLNNPTVSTLNRIGDTRGDFQSWDFPQVAGPTAVGTLNTACSYSASFTKAGIRFGDVCTTGVDQAIGDWTTVTPLVTAANTYKLRLCIIGISDGGVTDQADSGYTTRCFGNTAR